MTNPTTYTSYPSLYTLGHAAVREIFADGDLVFEEKVDGSQFSFGVAGGALQCRSKRCIIDSSVPDLFRGAVATAHDLFDKGLLAEGVTYRGEAIQKPKHNTLCYDRVPRGNVIIYDIMVGHEDYVKCPDLKRDMADKLGLETVPVLHKGNLPSPETAALLLDRVSVLGGAKIEGYVVKNYSRFGHDKKPLFAKFVSEAFKEVHQGEWRKANPKNGDVIEILVAKYRTPARWEKALQHLRDDGKLTGTPKDIGPIIVECQADIKKECTEEMKQFLFDWAWRQVAHKLVGGLPEWYKNKLFEQMEEAS